jgi:hypothetical protein
MMILMAFTFSAALASRQLRHEAGGSSAEFHRPMKTPPLAASGQFETMNSTSGIAHNVANGSYTVVNISAVKEFMKANCNILLSGGYYTDEMGIYTKITQTTSGRPVYQFGSLYLYYSSEYACWHIGTVIGSNSNLYYIAEDSASTPDLITAPWYSWEGEWLVDFNIRATCTGACSLYPVRQVATAQALRLYPVLSSAQ